jgi:rabenosyn-5
MIEIRSEINSLKPHYLRICESLLAGETSFTLDRAQTERVRIVKACESFDGISKRILSLCAAPGKDPISPREEKLYKNIRQAAASFLQTNMIYLQPLPKPEELQEMREARERERQEAERREAERRRERKEQAEKLKKEAAKQKCQAIQNMDGSESLDSALSGHSGGKGKGESGDVAWVPESNPVIKEEHDPFLLQYQRLVGYIEQAHKANRLDEVEALEISLRQIEREIIERKYQNVDRR